MYIWRLRINDDIPNITWNAINFFTQTIQFLVEVEKQMAFKGLIKINEELKEEKQLLRLKV